MNIKAQIEHLLVFLKTSHPSQSDKEQAFKKTINLFLTDMAAFTANNFDAPFTMLRIAASFGLFHGVRFLITQILPSMVPVPYPADFSLEEFLIVSNQKLYYERALIMAAQNGFPSIVRLLLNADVNYEGRDQIILAMVRAAKNNLVYGDHARVLTHLYPEVEATKPTEQELKSEEVVGYSLKNLVKLGVQMEDLQEYKINFNVERDLVFLNYYQAYKLACKRGIHVPVINDDVRISFSQDGQAIDLFEISNAVNTDFLIYIFEHILLNKRKVAQLKIDMMIIPAEIKALIHHLQTAGLVTNLSIHEESISFADANKYATLLSRTSEKFVLEAYEARENPQNYEEAIHSLATVAKECPLLDYSISSIELGSRGAMKLAQALQESKTLLRLTYADTDLDSSGLAALVRPLSSIAARPPLVYLDVSFNTFNPEAHEPLSQLIRSNPTLTHLELSHCGLFEEGASVVLTALQQTPHSRLKYLGLAGNNIEYFSDNDPRGEMNYYDHMHNDHSHSFFQNNRSLASIDLSDNHLAPKMLASIFSGLEFNATLQYLALCRMKKHLRQPLENFLDRGRNKTLLQLDVSESRIPEELSDRVCAYTQNNYQLFLRTSQHWIIVALGMQFAKNAPASLHELKLIGIILNFSLLQLDMDLEEKAANAVNATFGRKCKDLAYPNAYLSRFDHTIFYRKEMAALARSRLNIVQMKDAELLVACAARASVAAAAAAAPARAAAPQQAAPMRVGHLGKRKGTQ